MKTIECIKPTTSLADYRAILTTELSAVTGVAAKALSRASISRDEVVVFAKVGSKTYKGVFKVWDKTLTVITL